MTLPLEPRCVIRQCVPYNAVPSPSAPSKRRMTRAEGSVRPQPAPNHIRERRQARRKRLRALGYADYADYLRSSHWKRLKLEYRASNLPQECVCGEADVHLHHLTYERIGAERLSDLTPLCGPCHSMVHVLEFRGDLTLNLDGLCDEERAEKGRALLAQYAEEARRQRAARISELQAEVLALPFAARVIRARVHARARHVDISKQMHVLKLAVRKGRSDRILTSHLRRVEEIAYGWEGWRNWQ